MGRPVAFASLALRLLPPRAAGIDTKELVFRTAPSVNKVEVKRFLEALYGLKVQKVTTANYDGKKKRGKYGFMRQPDWKKVWVTLSEPVHVPEGAFLGPTKAAEEAKPKQ